MAGSKMKTSQKDRKLRDRRSEVSEATRLLDDDSLRSDHDDDNASGQRQSGGDAIDDFAGLPWYRVPSVFWLLFPFAIFTLAFGGVIVPKLNLILDLVCQQYFADQELIDPDFSPIPIVLGADNPQCLIPEVQSSVATFILAMNLCTGILSAIVAPKLGHLSDRYGRTKLMALASCGGLANEIITILAAKFPETVNYRWLILGSIFDGATGSFTTGSILSQSYTSDCTPPSKRAVSIGYLHACLFSGLAFGPLIAGYFVKWTGSLLSIFYIVLGCHTFFVLFIRFVIPESLSLRKRKLAKEKWEKEKAEHIHDGSWLSTVRTANPLQPLKILWPQGAGTSTKLRINLIVLAFNDFVILGSSMAIGSVLMLYSEYTFRWGTFETSQYISAVSMVRVVVLTAILPSINYIFRIRPARKRQQLSGPAPPDKNAGADRLDLVLIRVAFISDIIGSLGYVFTRTPALFVLSGATTALGGLGGATIQAVVTKHVPSERIGQILGAIGLLHALARVVGPVLFNGLYAATVGKFTQAVFVLMVSIYVLGLLSTFLIRTKVHWDESEPTSPTGGTPRTHEATEGELSLDEEQALINAPT